MADLAAVETRLRAILQSHAGAFPVQEAHGGLLLELPGHEGKPWGWAAGVRPGKRYVSFYLMPVYALPELLDGISPALRRRMQGKSCFNFSSVDEALLEELADLTARVLGRDDVVAAAMAAHPRYR